MPNHTSMNRRTLLALVSSAALLAAGPAFADFEDQVRKQLQKQGYKRIEVSSTLLGRTRIFASKKDGSREIILNPRTGEILRDMWTAKDSNGGPQIAGSDDSATDGGGKGSGDDGSSDDGGSDDGGDDSGDDNSGKGNGEDGGNDDGGDDGGDDNSGKDGGDDGGED